MSQAALDSVEPVVSGAPLARSSMLSKIIIVLMLIAVVAAECILAQLFLPSASEVAAVAGAGASAASHGAETTVGPLVALDEEGAVDGANQTEVDLGEFSVTAYQPVSNTTLRIDFHLYGTVGSGDEKEFLRLIEENKHRFREQVLVIVRSAEVTDLTDAGLGLVKRKILDKTNRIIGRPLLKAVIFSDFSFIEQ
ncbi:MAG: hypothetical protein ACOY3P_22375 [Planctomycetota bacterium]